MILDRLFQFQEENELALNWIEGALNSPTVTPEYKTKVVHQYQAIRRCNAKTDAVLIAAYKEKAEQVIKRAKI
jgi:hypothetical protein